MKKYKPSNWRFRLYKNTFRMSVSCNLLTICASTAFSTPKREKAYEKMRTEGTCTILSNLNMYLLVQS